MKIGIIGTGNMATSLIKGFKSQKKNKIYCFDLDPKKLSFFKKAGGVKIATNNKEVVEKSEIIFLCVKPDSISIVLEEIKKTLTPKKLLVSIAAGVKISYIEKYIGRNFKIIRSMPNLPCLVSKGVFGFKANSRADVKDIESFLLLVSTVGKAFEIKKEKDFDYVTAISGSGPAFLAEYIAAQLVYAGSKGLSSSLAKQLVFETIVGAVEYLKVTGVSPSAFVDLVSSPGGTTVEGVNVLKNKNFTNIIIKCFDSASKKSKEIADKLVLEKN